MDLMPVVTIAALYGVVVGCASLAGKFLKGVDENRPIPKDERPHTAVCGECGSEEVVAYWYGGRKPLCRSCAKEVLN